MIAVGLGWCLGFQLPWNFLSPYSAVGFAEIAAGGDPTAALEEADRRMFADKKGR